MPHGAGLEDAGVLSFGSGSDPCDWLSGFASVLAATSGRSPAVSGGGASAGYSLSPPALAVPPADGSSRGPGSPASDVASVRCEVPSDPSPASAKAAVLSSLAPAARLRPRPPRRLRPERALAGVSPLGVPGAAAAASPGPAVAAGSGVDGIFEVSASGAERVVGPPGAVGTVEPSPAASNGSPSGPPLGVSTGTFVIGGDAGVGLGGSSPTVGTVSPCGCSAAGEAAWVGGRRFSSRRESPRRPLRPERSLRRGPRSAERCRSTSAREAAGPL